MIETVRFHGSDWKENQRVGNLPFDEQVGVRKMVVMSARV
jgi:hypothetical protein